MCGRFVIAGNKASIRDAFSVNETFQDELKPSWNVAPMQGIPFVSEQLREGELVRRLEIARWGLVPVWSKDPKAGARMINARSETVTEKPSFRTAAAKRRALIPANGYYEWQKNEDGTKTPHYLHGQEEDQLLGFAGLYEFWADPTKAEDAEDKWLVTATILTRAAHDALGHIHDRTPVIIPKDLHEQRRAAEREGEPVRVVVEKTPPRTIERSRQVWVKPDPNVLADALDENPELVGPVLQRIVQLAVGRRLSERSRVRLGISIAHFVAELIKARSPWDVYPAAATARDFTAEQWGQLAAAGDQITAAERALDDRAEMLTRYEKSLRRDREQYQQSRELQEEQTAQKYALAREHERETRRLRDRLQVLEAQARYQGGQKGPGPGSSFHLPTS